MSVPRSLLLLALALGISCAKPPDPDGTPAAARPLRLDYTHRDDLNCGRNDCTDWYRTRIDEEGTLSLRVSSAADAADPPRFTVTVTDSSGHTLTREQSLGRAEIYLSQDVAAAPYLIAVASHHPKRAFSYTIHAGFLPAPPPPEPEPSFELHTSAVLELEGWGSDSQAVLIESGLANGLRPGLRGRLIEDGETIGEIVLEEVYPEGSRGRIVGALQAPVTPNTVVEIEVPVGPAAASEDDADAP